MANFNIDYLVVAGGGSGGGFGGGGGGGGVLSNVGATSLVLVTGDTYSLAVGTGGTRITYGTGGYPNYTPGQQGGSSSISGTGITTITSIGGGGGNSYQADATQPGGSGGGGSTGRSSGGIVGRTGTSGQGNNGGNGITYGSTGNTYGAGGGGGGAGAIGGNAFLGGGVSVGGGGGNGIQSSITGTPTYYAGGGGGMSYPSGGGASSLGGGGAGGNYNGGAGVSAQNGTNNLGGGGGGSYGYQTATVGLGGSGVVILRYTTNTINGYTTTGITPTEDTTTVPGQTILSFTTVGTGTITFTVPPPPPPPPFDGTKVTTPVTGFNKTSTGEGLKLPSGDNSNQPVGALAEQGMIRNDTEETVDSSASAITHYNGTNWRYFAATESPDVVYPTSLKMYLDASDTTSYPGTGTTWFDLTSNANNGTINGATWNPGGYFDFDGGNDYVDINNFVNSFFNNAVNKIFSVSIWFNPDQLPTSSTPFQLWQFGVWSNGTIRAFLLDNGKINFQSTTGGSSYVNQLNSSTSYSIGNWNNLVCIYDGTTKHLYLNNNSPNSAVHNYDIQTNTGSIGKDDSNSFYFNGKISKFNVYDTVLTQAEITAIYNEGR